MKGIPKQIKRFEEIIGDRSLRTKPSLEDFLRGRIAIREDLVENILRNLVNKHFCLIVGPKNSGKTWLCYAIGFKLKTDKKPLRFIEVDRDFNASEIWGYMNQFRGKGYKIFYLIIEDCQNNKEGIKNLLEKFPSELENLRFIFTMRSPLNIFQDLSAEEKYEVRLGKLNKETIEHVKKIIRKFIENNNVNQFLKGGVKEEEIEYVSRKWGYDLNGVSLRLTYGWNFRGGMKLSEVTDDHVYESYWSSDGKIRLENPERRKILLHISALCQFEPLMVSSLFLYSIDPETVSDLKDEQIIEIKKWRNNDFFTIPEDDAKWILRTLSSKISVQFVENETKNIFKKYIESRPLNWMHVFYDLYLAKNDNPFAEEILAYLLYDGKTWETVKEISIESSLLDIIHFLEAISWINPPQEYIQNFLLYYIERKGISIVRKEIRDWKAHPIYLHRLYTLTPIDELKVEIISNLNRRLRSATAKKINRELASLHKNWGLDFRSFFDTFSVTDFISIINKSQLKSIRTLFRNFIEHRNLVNAPFMLRFAKALVDERVDWNRLLAQGNPSLYRLNGLVQLVEKVDPQFAIELVERLSQLDLNELFSRDVDPVAAEKGISKAKTVNDFHTQLCKLRISHLWERIISKINDETWSNILYSSDVEQNLWLLWNIYRHDELKAQRLARAHEHFIKESIFKAKFPPIKLLTSLGILHFCGINIQKIQIDKINVEEIKQTLDELKNKERLPCTQIILSLITLKVKLPPNQFQIFKEILNEPQIKKSIYKNDDPQLGQVLQKVAEEL